MRELRESSWRDIRALHGRVNERHAFTRPEYLKKEKWIFPVFTRAVYLKGFHLHGRVNDN